MKFVIWIRVKPEYVLLADRNNGHDNKVNFGENMAASMEISDSSAIMTMNPEIIDHAVNNTSDEENSVYSSGMVPYMMWKIREDCEKLMASYNESNDGMFPLKNVHPLLAYNGIT